MTAPDAALGPVRRALLEAAHEDARRIVAAARADAARVLEQAAEDERAIRQGARDRGAAEGLREAAVTGRHARRQAQRAVLMARRTAYDRLRSEVLARLEAQRSGPAYPGLLRQLTDRARSVLGADARVAEAADGGIVARAGGCRLDLSFPVLADQAMAALGGDLEGLWEP